MSTFITRRAPGSGAKFALLMLTAGLSLAAIGTASAAPADRDVPTLVIHYSPETLATDSGVQSLYHKLVNASERVCPEVQSTRFVSDVVRACRRQALARAVAQINNPHLAALYATSSQRG